MICYCQMSCFVTVGSTQFDELIETVCTKEAISALKERGVSSVLIQCGNGKYRPVGYSIDDEWFSLYGMQVCFYRFKKAIIEDLRRAHIVIAHGGAGTCLEILELSKAGFVVINEHLMDNHQTELVERLAELGHIIYATPAKLVTALETADVSCLKPFSQNDTSNFVKYIDRTLGIVHQY
ncbi:unnamed protein product [Anisakis simplex]|uniref:UDP-N-acetylglucosamine transferase subunit ALG13 n=1 Tax=Anisakis simplex TaxID=6269 RepID=A0A0M3JWB7_ANISI|nr:unnamed protein product [Anisakis simplex]